MKKRKRFNLDKFYIFWLDLSYSFYKYFLIKNLDYIAYRFGKN